MTDEFMNDINTILFDFDGTIADSFDETLKSVIKISGDFGIGEISEKDIELYRNKGAYEIIKKARVPIYKLPFLVKKGQSEVSKIIGRIKPFSGIRRVILKLKNKGYILGILTSNNKNNVEMFLKNNNLEVFNFVYCGGSIFGKVKLLKRLIKNEKLDKRNLVYVGDEIRDIKAAREVGIKSIAVTWGFNVKGALKGEKPDYIVDTTDELLEILTKS